jgi:hypothetical protein
MTLPLKLQTIGQTGGIRLMISVLPMTDNIKVMAVLCVKKIIWFCLLLSMSVSVNGREHLLEVPAQIINGRIMLPVCAVAESAEYAYIDDEIVRDAFLAVLSGEEDFTSKGTLSRGYRGGSIGLQAGTYNINTVWDEIVLSPHADQLIERKFKYITFVDMNDDGIFEVLISHNTLEGALILHYNKGNIYGDFLWWKFIGSQVKSNGVIYHNCGVSESAYKIIFNEGAFSLTQIAWQYWRTNPGVKNYIGGEFQEFITESYIGNKPSTSKLFNEVIEPHRNANEVIWHDKNGILFNGAATVLAMCRP